jgi:thiamine biosynthesis lipoprotein ApbE
MELLSATERHMATDVAISISVEKQKKFMASFAIQSCFQKIKKWEAEISEFHPDSPVYLVNRARPGEKIKASESLITLLKLSLSLKDKTKGAFDPLCKSTGEGKISFDQAAGQIWRETDSTHLSFGAIGKGFILDRVRMALEADGLSDFQINAGGSSIILSGYLQNQPARWAWSWKKENDSYFGREFLHRSGNCIALGVSGNMEQGFHIRDRDQSFANHTQSALVAHPSAAIADALSTALFVHGWKDLEMFRDPLAFMPMALIDQNENMFWNGDFAKAWGNPC